MTTLKLAAVAILVVLGIYLAIGAATRSTPTATPQPAATGAIGATGHLRPVPDYDYSILFVDELGLSAFTRAYENRDRKGESQALTAFEILRVADNTPVRVTNRGRDAIQVEILSGEYASRRGWTDPLNLIP